MDIQIERTAKALYERHRTGRGAPVRVTSLPDLVRGQRAVDDAQHPAHHCRAGWVASVTQVHK
jgi:hypothetical protein